MSQRDEVEGYLLQGGAITPIDALTWFGCFRLASIIHTLRSEGMSIITEMVESENGKRFASYKLETDDG